MSDTPTSYSPSPDEAPPSTPELRPDRGSRPLRLVQVGLVLTFLAVPAIGGLLSLVQVVRDGINGVDGLGGASSVDVSPDGRFLYAVGETDDAIVAMSRDASGDSLGVFQVVRDLVGDVFGLDGPASIAISPDGAHVYVASRADSALAAFGRDASTGELAFSDALFDGVGGIFGLGGAADVAVSPDGEHVFVVGSQDDAVAVFARDPSIDVLAFVDVAYNFNSGVVGLRGPAGVAVSPDGEWVYVASREDGALAVFDRTATLDDIAFQESFFDGVGGVDFLAQATSVAVSPDGRFVYVTSWEDDAITIFERVGQGLVLRDSYRDQVAGIDGLDGASSVALSPSGNLLFVAGELDDAIAVFHRSADGSLDFIETVADGTGGVEGLDGPVTLVVSPDSVHVYAAARNSSSVVGFRLVESLLLDGFESGDVASWTNAVPAVP